MRKSIRRTLAVPMLAAAAVAGSAAAANAAPVQESAPAAEQTGTGVITAVPLLLFAAGTRRIPLTVVGMLQFLTPIMQFLIGLSREHMPPERWAGFVIVWLAVAVFVVDSLVAARRHRRR